MSTLFADFQESFLFLFGDSVMWWMAAAVAMSLLLAVSIVFFGVVRRMQ